ncbi:HNH endonuclease [Proteus mirabilis]|uniref:HNH endonuclease n=1 Tax=Proteus mirabilis TaxID=584 RepID=UPI0034D6E30C
MVESKEFPGYFIVPEVPEILVSKDDKVYNYNTGKFYDSYIGEVGYLIASSYFIHRLKALAFLPRPSGVNVSKLHVNHMDGNKLNNDISNLEWCTPSDNVTHAYMVGLRTDNIPLFIRDTVDGDTQVAYSLNEAARRLDITPSMLSMFLSKRRKSLLLGRYVIKLETEEWPDLKSLDINGMLIRPVCVKDIESGDIKIFTTIKECAGELGYKRQTINAHLKHRSHKAFKGLMIVYVDDPIIIEKFNRQYATSIHRQIPKRKPIPVKVVDNTTGVEVEWASVQAFAESIGVLKNTVQKAMYLNNGRWKNFTITYNAT